VDGLFCSSLFVMKAWGWACWFYLPGARVKGYWWEGRIVEKVFIWG
jgi:hypothetical protein